MDPDQPFRTIAIAGAIVLFPIVLCFRLRSQASREKLDRWQEGPFILFTLRPLGISFMIGFLAYLIDPASMRWSSVALPDWLRWTGVGLALSAGTLLIWTLLNLGKNLTDTVVTRKAHTLVTTGPYQWVRHPFYVAVLLTMLANSLVAANWFLMLTGALVFALMVIRTPREEERLLGRFGDSYRAYMERTGRFLPRFRGFGSRHSHFVLFAGLALLPVTAWQRHGATCGRGGMGTTAWGAAAIHPGSPLRWDHQCP